MDKQYQIESPLILFFKTGPLPGTQTRLGISEYVNRRKRNSLSNLINSTSPWSMQFETSPTLLMKILPWSNLKKWQKFRHFQKELLLEKKQIMPICDDIIKSQSSLKRSFRGHLIITPSLDVNHLKKFLFL